MKEQLIRQIRAKIAQELGRNYQLGLEKLDIKELQDLFRVLSDYSAEVTAAKRKFF